MRRVAPALTALACAAAAACALKSSSPGGFAPACTNSGQCDATLVCFLGECRGRSAALTLVAAEVRPPNDAELGVVQEGRINLATKARPESKAEAGRTHDLALDPATGAYCVSDAAAEWRALILMPSRIGDAS